MQRDFRKKNRVYGSTEPFELNDRQKNYQGMLNILCIQIRYKINPEFVIK